MYKVSLLSVVIFSMLFLSGNFSKKTKEFHSDICIAYLDVTKEYVMKLQLLISSDESNFSKYLVLQGSAAPIGLTIEKLVARYKKTLEEMKEKRAARVKECRVAMSNGVCTEEDISLFTVVFKKASNQIENAKVIDDLLGLEELTFPSKLSAECRAYFER